MDTRICKLEDRIADQILPQVLAVDLLNPSAAAEAKKHKLKVRFEYEVIVITK
jgi:hypothetical protein